ncbi:UNVERIFIED_CONTAM: hypothetical protein GTU68_005903 [Idotea baltica]|nr:hypothetical protein [Idotea baltica]
MYGQLAQFHGKAVCVKIFEDNSLVKSYLAASGHGQVLVVDGGASLRRALVGDQLASKAIQNGWAGIIVYGCIRDAAIINTMEVAIKAMNTCPIKTEKRGIGDKDIPVHFAGVHINPGDWIYSDIDGIISSSIPLHL